MHAIVLLISALAFAPQSSAPQGVRRLTAAQERTLLTSARRFKGQKISIARIGGDVEAETFAGDILGVLKRAEWEVADLGFAPEVSGVFVAVNQDAKATAAAQMLVESLQAFGVVSNGGNNDRLPASEIRLIVGRRPAAAAPLKIPIVTAHSSAMQADPFVCPRSAPGDLVNQPEGLRSVNGSLRMELSLHEGVDVQGLKVLCYLTASGVQSPTVRVRPGDELILTLKNELSASFERAHVHEEGPRTVCAGGPMDPSSTNLHFHGWSVPPVCHQDETLRTAIQPSDPPFEYSIRIPKDQAPGLYWYHPHPHGFTEAQVLGGASGALIVEGMEKKRPEMADIPERVLVLRDQRVAGLEEREEEAGPGKNISINFVPVQYPLYRPAEMVAPPHQREFWRILNASADSYFDLQARYDQVPQPLELVALDGVPVGSRAKRTHILLAPGARAEFIATMPSLGRFAQLVSLSYDTGPDGAKTPYKVLATIRSRAGTVATGKLPSTKSAPPKPFPSLAGLAPDRRRTLYFSEDLTNPKDPKYFITVDGATPKQFRMNFTKPDVEVRSGTIEDWVIENRAREAHAFHIHQVHFQVLERDRKPVNDSALRDTIDLPYWDGKSPRYPSVKLRMDFRSPEIVGTFAFHCHILEHGDAGMMGSIQVLPPGSR